MVRKSPKIFNASKSLSAKGVKVRIFNLIIIMISLMIINNNKKFCPFWLQNFDLLMNFNYEDERSY